LIDLPRLPEGEATDPGETSEFGKELLHFATAMGLPSKLLKSISKFDFSRTSHVRFVHTMSVVTSDSAQTQTPSNFQTAEVPIPVLIGSAQGTVASVVLSKVSA
jgi:hypothetical protein